MALPFGSDFVPDSEVSGPGAVFGTEFSGAPDMTDVGRMSEYDAHHGAYQGIDLTDPELMGMAIGDDQAKALGFENRRAALGHTFYVTNYSTGQTAPVTAIDLAPLHQAHVELTPAAHAAIGSNGSHDLGISAIPPQQGGFVPDQSPESGQPAGLPVGKDFIPDPPVQPTLQTDQYGQPVPTPQGQPEQLPPEERNLQAILERHLAEGSQNGVYPKAIPYERPVGYQPQELNQYGEVPATQPQPSWQEKFLSGLEQGHPMASLQAFDQAAQQGVQNALGPAMEGGLFEPQVAPELSMPREERTAQTPAQFLDKTMYNAVADSLNFMRSPAGIATLGMGALPRGVISVISAAFGSQMAQQAIEAAKEGRWSDFVENLGFGALGAKGAHDLSAQTGAPVRHPESYYEVKPDVPPVPQPPPLPISAAPPEVATARVAPTAETPVVQQRIQDLVAKGMPEEQAARQVASQVAPKAEINIGLDVGGVHDALKPEEVALAIDRAGGKITDSIILPRTDQSETTYHATVEGLSQEAVHQIAQDLQQESIAVRTAPGEGYLAGPKAAEWGPYNEDFFRRPTNGTETAPEAPPAAPEEVPAPLAPKPTQTQPTGLYGGPQAATAIMREQAGLKAYEHAGQEDFGPAWSEAAAREAANPGVGQRLVQEIIHSPRAVRDAGERALLIRELIRAEETRDAAAKEVNANPGNSAAQADFNAAHEELLNAVEALDKSGSTAGSALNLSKMTFDRFGNLGTMQALVQASQKGKELSPKQIKQTEQIYQKMVAIRAKEAAPASELYSKIAKDKPKTKAAIRDWIMKQGDVSAAALKEKLQKGQQLGIVPRGQGPDPTMVYHAAMVVARNMWRGAEGMSTAMKRAIPEVGDWAKPFAREIYEKALGIYDRDAVFGRLGEFLTDKQKASISDRSARRVREMFEKFDVATTAGQAKRGEAIKHWYRDLGDAFHNVFGAGPDMVRFTKLFGTFGANKPPIDNARLALRVFADWHDQGRPRSTEAISQIIMKHLAPGAPEADVRAWLYNATRVLRASDKAIYRVRLSGPKVNPYAANLLGYEDFATLDRHMATRASQQLGEPWEDVNSQWFGGRQMGKDFVGNISGQGLKGMAYEAHLREVAKYLTGKEEEPWTVRNVQAGVWGDVQPYKIMAREMRVPVGDILPKELGGRGTIEVPQERLKELQNAIKPERLLEQVQPELERAKQSVQAERARRSEQAPHALVNDPAFLQRAERRAAEAKVNMARRAATLYYSGPAGLTPSAISEVATVVAARIMRFGYDRAKVYKSMVEEYGPAIKNHFDQAWTDAKQFTHDAMQGIFERNLKAYKARTTKSIAELQRKIATGDIEKPPKFKTPLDNEAFQLRRQKEDLTNKLNSIIEEARIKNMTPAEKLARNAARLHRGSVLGGIQTFEKIGSASIMRGVIEPTADAIVISLAKQVPGLSRYAAGASRSPTFRGQIAGFKGAARGIKEMPGVLAGKIGTHEGRGPGGILEYPQQAHAAAKRPAWRAEYERSLMERGQRMVEQGIDTSDPQVQDELHIAAKKDADAAIFLGKNVGASGLNALIRTLGSGKYGKVPEYAARYLLPVIRVGFNIATETVRASPVGLGETGIQLGIDFVKAWRNGLDSIPAEHKAVVMRNLAKGLLGTAAFFTGYYNSNSFGGLYTGKPSTDRLKPMQASLFGVPLPKFIFHVPLLIQMQIGATVRKQLDKHKGAFGASAAVIKGLEDLLPVTMTLDTFARMASSGKSLERQIGSQLQSNIPRGLQDIAEWLDTKKNRYPQKWYEFPMTSIPGFRQHVRAYKPESTR